MAIRATAGISVVIPTFRRVERLEETLTQLEFCEPAPAEIIVHIDAGDHETEEALRTRWPHTRRKVAEMPQGPGGARNWLIAAAEQPVVVSLDDDSYPIDADFFAKVLAAFKRHPEAGVVAMHIAHDDEQVPDRKEFDLEVADFVGCGCAYRRDAFLSTSGYVPLHPAYGIEETDLTLQLLDRGWRIILCQDLRIRHATDRKHQSMPSIVAAHVRNTLLLAFLRYPTWYAGLGAWQFLNRIRFSLSNGHVTGTLQGIISAPKELYRWRHHRKAVQVCTVRKALKLRHGKVT